MEVSEPSFPDAPMIHRLRAYEAGREAPVRVIKVPHVPAELRDRLDRIVENHPFMEGAP